MTGRESVVITGIGLLTPAGDTVEAVWDALLLGRSMARTLDRFDASAHPVSIGCQVDARRTPKGASEKQLRRLDPFARYGLTAALDAVADAGAPRVDPQRTTIVVGNAVGGRTTSDSESIAYATRGTEAVSPLMPVVTMPNAAAVAVSMALGSTGPALTLATTCASGADAIGTGVTLLRSGSTDLVIAGGCEATLSPVTLAAFARLGALSTRSGDPALASRPFDADRDGFVMGEGAAFVVLERESDAKARGARIHGEVLGYAAGSDAHHLSMPHPEGDGALRVMSAALRDAGIDSADIGHVNAHGTSTRLNDAVEARALGRLFGRYVPPVTAVKGVTGHLLGASGALEAVVAMLAARRGLVPPVANHDRTDPAIALDVVAGVPREVRPAPALSTSFGFGGHNAALVVA
ncbi:MULTISPECIES: beta-ketoacyl-[acyl-carrier-protein] synthase family protein [unclassified Rathayibacter]|uniref:beta-ketoacyl-[acyl-carrier-protein] synthase family protein n=1 Tax=unclassified Rathayibacter TaxID=2609250 RepID=UPI00188BAC2D|nr:MULTISPECIES: beta-ketoacyl-[acyl-carrier-protein] synthase family protein [unclassified Rathayibacter]MBF4463170.1 beta-ketoacyl-[acyl-carrier-protein] synthase family protein [Rathayibacter sp. VKM Ac-2879]MBF4504593.1 beta-ketoacyl-[acyl-carrier-protein] synthase family protein [Rathayibacter sp. VKM Ac-2878]